MAFVILSMLFVATSSVTGDGHCVTDTMHFQQVLMIPASCQGCAFVMLSMSVAASVATLYAMRDSGTTMDSTCFLFSLSTMDADYPNDNLR